MQQCEGVISNVVYVKRYQFFRPINLNLRSVTAVNYSKTVCSYSCMIGIILSTWTYSLRSFADILIVSYKNVHLPKSKSISHLKGAKYEVGQ